MTAAPFIAWCSTWSPAAEPADPRDPTDPAPVHGIALVEPGRAALRAELGMAGALPMALVGGIAGVTDDVDVGAHVSTHAGLAHAFGLTLRWRASPHLGAGLVVDESLYTVEQLGGIQALRVPFGDRLAATPTALGRWTTGAGVDLAAGLGFEVGLVRLEDTLDGGAARSLRPALDDVWVEVAASWPKRHGSLYVRGRVLVPVATEFHVLGYVPVIAIGRSWRLG